MKKNSKKLIFALFALLSITLGTSTALAYDVWYYGGFTPYPATVYPYSTFDSESITAMNDAVFDQDTSDDKVFVNKVDSIKKDKLTLRTAKSEISEIIADLKKNPRPKMSKEEINQQNEKIFGK